jgi:hypothetical protein
MIGSVFGLDVARRLSVRASRRHFLVGTSLALGVSIGHAFVGAAEASQWPQDAPSVVGQVANECTGDAVVAARIGLLGSVNVWASTGQTGEFALWAIPRGQYAVWVLAPGYNEISLDPPSGAPQFVIDVFPRSAELPHVQSPGPLMIRLTPLTTTC